MSAQPQQELDDAHRERAMRLLRETQGKGFTNDQFLAAYNAVLLKDIFWCLNELVIYKQNEVNK